MTKTIKETARRWKVSEATARKYCQSGIIPPAEKIGKRGKWMIPENWDKPPMTRHGLCYLLDTVYQLQHGVSFVQIQWGYTKDEVKEGFRYLASSAFISSLDIDNLESALLAAVVTPRGVDLINRENKESEGKTNYKVALSAKANIGLLSAEAGIELTNEH